MTVGELIETLRNHANDLPVYVRGYEAGVDDVAAAYRVEVCRDYYDESYYGAHEMGEDVYGPLGVLYATPGVYLTAECYDPE